MRTLVLCHRIPYPPDKGEKIRAWHLIRGLAAVSDVHLGAFVDDPDDWAGVPELEAVCAEVFLRPLSRYRAMARALMAVPGGGSLSVAHYADRGMRDWVARQLPAADAVLAYSSVMAQYVPPNAPEASRSCTAKGRARHPEPDAPQAPPPRTTHDPAGAAPPHQTRIADYVDVDSEKFRAYGQQGGLMAPVYRLEAARLARFEREAAHRFDRVLFVSDEEANCFLRLAPEHAGAIHGLPNGVDTAYFSPQAGLADPYPPGGPVIAFTGAMDYRPNVDAVCWFAGEILPRIRRRHPDARFCIVGLRPVPEVRALADDGGIIVTGRVPDVRPYVAHSALTVAPLRIARGVQNKVLEAMALGRPVVATPAALEGLAGAGDAVMPAPETAADFADAVAALLADPARAAALGRSARAHVVAHHAWSVSQARLVDQLGLGAGPEPRAGRIGGMHS